MLEDTRYLTSNQVATRYQIQRRSLNRWRAHPTMGFPQPTEINGRCYYKVSELEAFDRRVLMASLAKKEAA